MLHAHGASSADDSEESAPADFESHMRRLIGVAGCDRSADCERYFRKIAKELELFCLERKIEGFYRGRMRWSSLNGNVFGRSSELIFQSYYQAHLVGSTYFEPVITYIPSPLRQRRSGCRVGNHFASHRSLLNNGCATSILQSC